MAAAGAVRRPGAARAARPLADEACAAAERIGWPIVLKAVSDQIAHKTELGLVRLDLRDRGELVAAWER